MGLRVGPLARADTDSLKPGEKILHFLRHAEGIHNVDRSLVKKMAAHDAALVANGVAQCEGLARDGPTSALRPQLVVSSPLTRTLMTAKLCVPACSSASNDGAPAVPLVALEHLRETVNFLCDGRRSLSTIAAEVPGVDFTLCANDEDAIWRRYEDIYGTQDEFDGLRETDLQALISGRRRRSRGSAGRRQNRRRFAHAAFLRHLFVRAREGQPRRPPQCFEYADAHVAGFMRAYFGNAEMRSVIASFRGLACTRVYSLPMAFLCMRMNALELDLFFPSRLIIIYIRCSIFTFFTTALAIFAAACMISDQSRVYLI